MLDLVACACTMVSQQWDYNRCRYTAVNGSFSAFHYGLRDEGTGKAVEKVAD